MFVEKMVVLVGNYVFITGIHVIYYIILQAGKSTETFERILIFT